MLGFCRETRVHMVDGKLDGQIDEKRLIKGIDSCNYEG